MAQSRIIMGALFIFALMAAVPVARGSDKAEKEKFIKEFKENCDEMCPKLCAEDKQTPDCTTKCLQECVQMDDKQIETLFAEIDKMLSNAGAELKKDQPAVAAHIP